MMLNPVKLGQDQEKIQQSGVQSCLTKPVKMRELFYQIETILLGRQIGDTTVEAATGTGGGEKPLKILLVDDNQDNRLLVSAYLKKLPYTLDEAENGEEAFNRFSESEYDIVLMDVQMPVMDGREATRKIREWERQQGRQPIPVIALTAHAIREEIDLCMEAGCDAHLSKPVKKSTLISTIQTFTG